MTADEIRSMIRVVQVLDDKDLMRAYMRGIQDGVDFVFDTMKKADIKEFNLKYADTYCDMVREQMKHIMVTEKLEPH